MAKGKGSAGRTGRTRDMPQVVGEGPRKRRSSGGGGSGISGGGIAGIGKADQPRKDLVFYSARDERASKPSQKIFAPQQGKYASTYKKSAENIDKVHNVPARMAPVQMATVNNPGGGYLGSHVRYQYEEKVKTGAPEGPQPGSAPPSVQVSRPPEQTKTRNMSHIDINVAHSHGKGALAEPGRRATVYHEYGHGLDAQLNAEKKTIPNKVNQKLDWHRRNFDSENAFKEVERQGTLEPRAGDSSTVAWAKEVQKSQSYKSLKVKQERATGQDRETLNYYLEPREQFARSYAQYVSEKTDPDAMKAVRADYRESSPRWKKDIGYSQWRGKDFEGVRTSLDNIFTENKLRPGDTARGSVPDNAKENYPDGADFDSEWTTTV